jgi:uncharacterized protein (DUF2141 family)
MSRPFTALAAATLSLIATAAQAETVHVTLSGVQAKPGRIAASLNTREQFMRGAGSYTAMATPTAGAVTLTFEGVAPGDYVLMVMHDENSNGRMDFGAMGPSEGWAFSNGDAPMMGPPEFDAHRFTVGAERVELTETMHYGQ